MNNINYSMQDIIFFNNLNVRTLLDIECEKNTEEMINVFVEYIKYRIQTVGIKHFIPEKLLHKFPEQMLNFSYIDDLKYLITQYIERILSQENANN